MSEQEVEETWSPGICRRLCYVSGLWWSGGFLKMWRGVWWPTREGQTCTRMQCSRESHYAVWWTDAWEALSMQQKCKKKRLHCMQHAIWKWVAGYPESYQQSRAEQLQGGEGKGLSRWKCLPHSWRPELGRRYQSRAQNCPQTSTRVSGMCIPT